MTLAIELPPLGMGCESAFVTWRKREGDSVQFGDVLCDLEARESEAVSRTKQASLLANFQALGKRAETKRKVRVRLRFHLIASEPALLDRIMVVDGERAKVGEVLATASWVEGPGQQEADEGDHRMRVVARILDSYGDDE